MTFRLVLLSTFVPLFLNAQETSKSITDADHKKAEKAVKSLGIDPSKAEFSDLDYM